MDDLAATVRVLAPGEASVYMMSEVVLCSPGGDFSWHPERRGDSVHVTVFIRDASGNTGPSLGKLVMTVGQWYMLAAVFADSSDYESPGN